MGLLFQLPEHKVSDGPGPCLLLRPGCASSWPCGLREANEPWSRYVQRSLPALTLSSTLVLEPQRRGCSAASTGFTEKQLWLCLPRGAFPACPRLSDYPALCSHSTPAVRGDLSANPQRAGQQTHVNAEVRWDCS